ncbi:hypothetical protein J6590_045834 [Homalodisca vitripennis]|nr:hypothetical protein J6590_045834 [Homalodisca vitripennis]
MCHSWFGRFAPKNIEEIQLIFPITGHSFLPPDRVFGVVAKELRTREEIINPQDIINILSAHATVKLGVDCEVEDFRSVALNCLKDIKQWNFQISKCKRIHFTKAGNNQIIYTRGESTYVSDLGKKQILTKKGVPVNRLNPDAIEKSNSEPKKRKKTLINFYVSTLERPGKIMTTSIFIKEL